MRTRTKLTFRVIGIVAIAAAVGWLQPTAAYGQTTEGTVINNIATVTFTDANSNTYSSVNGSVTVTVGFSAGVDVVAAQATATPVSPSTGNTMDFYVINIGNGTDSVSVAQNNSDATVLTVTNYRFNATNYATIGSLNAALAGAALAATDTAAIQITYDIASDEGGEQSTYTLTGTSRRDGTKTDNDNTAVTPALTGAVATTPDGAQNLTKQPSNGTNYAFTFTVQNNQNGPDDFDLLATSPGSPVITIVSVNGLAGDSTRITSLAASASVTIDVIYSVADVAAGSADTLYLEARSVANAAISNQGFADLTVIKGSMSITKLAYRDNQTTLLGGGDTVVPGEFIQYKVTVTNGGTATASSVHVDDVLPSALTYQSATGDLAGWSFANTGNDLDSDLTGTLAPAASRFFWIRVLLDGAAEAGASGTPAGTLISSRASLSYSLPNGSTGSEVSADAPVTIGQVAGVNVEPPRSSLAPSGTSILFPHTITNVGNGPDTFVLTATSLDGWPIRMVLDVNGDGTEDADDTPIVAPLALNADASAQILVVLDIPAGIPAAAARAAVILTATSQFDTSVADSITDDLEITASVSSLVLRKTVDAASAVAGDVLTYTITYVASGLGLNDLTVRDTLPAGLLYQAGTLRLGARTLTDVAGDDEGYYDDAAGVIVVTISAADVQPEDSILFQARVLPLRVGTTMHNVAVASSAAISSGVVTASNSVKTVIAALDLVLEKTVQGPNPARSGDELVYSIVLTNNANAGRAQDVVVTDTLPAGLILLDAGPDATVDGNVVTWAFGELDPGDWVEALLKVRFAGGLPGTVEAVNVANLSIGGEPYLTASAPSVLLLATDGDVLTLELKGETLEAQLGQPVYVSYMMENKGDVTVTDLELEIGIPDGLAWSGSLEAVDSIQTQPGQVTLFLEDLAAGGTLEGRATFALVSALPGNMVISAVAVGRTSGTGTSGVTPAVAAGRLVAAETIGAALPGVPAALHTNPSSTGIEVRSAEQQIFVAARAGTPLETRTVIGKIWIDEDGNGRQDSGELGVPGVSVWTDAGDVATTDSEGKLSFRNVRPGSHTFRVDRSTLPLALRVNREGDDGFASLRLNGWASGRISFGLIPRGARLVDFQVRTEEEATGGEISTLEGPAAPDAVVRRVLVLEPHRAGWPEVAYPVPEGWLPLPGAARLGDMPVADPEIRLDRDGSAWMFWTLDGLPGELRVTLEPEGAVRSAEPVTLPPLRSDEDRARDRRAGPANGPGVAFIAPVDGAVLGSDQLYVGALGEPDARATLFLGDSILAEDVMRGDGQVDFIGVALRRGTNRLRVRMINSWNVERWDSLQVHVTSAAASFAPLADTVVFPADGLTIREVRIRVLDAWGVPVLNRPFVTVSTGQAEVVDPDEDASSVGLQLRPGPDGWLSVRIRAASDVSVDLLALEAAGAAGEVALQHVPKPRDLMVTSLAQVGLGAAPDDFGSVTVRGRLDAETAITLAYDTRVLDAGRDAYGRTLSPLDDAQYPILGDASVRRSEASSRPGLSARIERGADWVAAGELSNMGFGTNLTLAQYRRALSGMAANVRTGRVAWSGFGAITSQSLRQVHIRGAGVSGPYDVGASVVPGTERVVVETRAFDNPERSLRLQTLDRLADYQIDYTTGTLLLKSPVPSVDLDNNPVFIVVTFESDGGGESAAVWGLRAETDVGVPLGLSVVRDGAEGASFSLVGADVRLRGRNGSELAAEVAYAEKPDSAGIAVLMSGQGNLLGGAVTLTGRWMHVANGFSNPSNLGLRAVDEIQVGTQIRVAGSEFRLGHKRATFAASGVERRSTEANVVSSPGRNVTVTVGFTDEAFVKGDVLGGASRSGRLKVAWQPSSMVRLWTEAQGSFLRDGDAGPGDFVGGGLSLALLSQLSLEARHLRVESPRDGSYSITRVGLKSTVKQGTQAWGSYEIAGGVDRQTNAAVVGLNQQIRLGQSWAVNAQMERRMGLERASVSDPLRVAPFTQQEDDSWSAALSAEFLPQDGPYSASAQLERRTGTLRSSSLANVAADVTFNRSLAILSRQTYNRVDDAATGRPTQRSLSSLWGLAFRPTGSDAVNALIKLEWRRDENRPLLNVFGTLGLESRLIGAAEVIWSPTADFEVGGRYAVRSTHLALGGTAPLRSRAHYLGSRLELGLGSGLAVGSEGRLLLEGTTGEMRWDLAPVFTVTPLKALEIASGYRLGDLRDPDFAATGGHGWFLTLQLRATEAFLSPITDYWRNRMRSTMPGRQ
ncbi:MAG: DUF11 domain-containing protein [Gemmatimonadetes bacterium]|nr:DUF11 domain-containing protein [Gemmatimonadota bacterium]